MKRKKVFLKNKLTRSQIRTLIMQNELVVVRQRNITGTYLTSTDLNQTIQKYKTTKDTPGHKNKRTQWVNMYLFFKISNR